MKTFMLFIASLSIIYLTGCTHTIDGIKKDASNMWSGTKEVVHDATED